ncbi:MAG: hypothetical protein O2816_10425 [Planctomycetota bacterium]|nr:hypothetical protein [Planctomycetota bacterium]
MAGRISKEGWVRGVGLVALLGLLFLFAGHFFWTEAPGWLPALGVGCAALALVCGLYASGRAWTMTLVVPSTVFLFLVLTTA